MRYYVAEKALLMLRCLLPSSVIVYDDVIFAAQPLTPPDVTPVVAARVVYATRDTVPASFFIISSPTLIYRSPRLCYDFRFAACCFAATPFDFSLMLMPLMLLLDVHVTMPSPTGMLDARNAFT